jgi:hypothetical protein
VPVPYLLNRLLKISQLLRHYKKFKLLRMDKYAATLNFFCSLHLEFLNSQPVKDFFNTLLGLLWPKNIEKNLQSGMFCLLIINS